MRLYSKFYAGKQLNWRDSDGTTWVIYPDPITGEVYCIENTGVMLDGYDKPFDVVEVAGVDGQPDEQFANYGDDNLVPMPDIAGAHPERDFFELPTPVALELLADSMQGHYFVDWRPLPTVKKRGKKVTS